MKLIDDLIQIVGQNSVFHDAETMRPFESDALSAFAQLPKAVVLPNNTAEIQKLVLYCSQNQIPIVPRGSGTSLSGGALPHQDGIVVSVNKLNRILEIDPKNKIARVQPAVRNIEVSEQAKRHGLFFAPDPSSQIICSIGGNIAENAGGIHCLKYGMTHQNIHSATFVLSDGSIHTFHEQSFESSGLNLLSLMIGSEGLLGICIEAELKLVPIAEKNCVLLAGFSTIHDAASVVSAIFSHAIIPAALEMMDARTVELVEKYMKVGYPTDAEAILICEIDGEEHQVNEDRQTLEKIFKTFHATSIQSAEDAQSQAKLWKGRKVAFPAAGKASPDYYCMDGTIARKDLPQVLAQIYELEKQYGLKVINVFHAGDGNLHPLILFDAAGGEFEKTEVMGDAILKLCVDAGGVISGEHGVGVEKLNSMCHQFKTEELQCFLALKKAIDPAGIFNPTKAIPTLKRCAELGREHVHSANQKFANLERF